jgi:mersacidin/lichenicidin family type 2 lantibiotic
MSKNETVRAWKNKSFRNRLSDARKCLPENPAGVVELSADELDGNIGADGCPHVRTIHLSCWDPDCSLVAPTKSDFNRGSSLSGG